MLDNQLEITAREAGRIIVFDLKGDFTEKAEKDFDTFIKPRLHNGCGVIMNFSSVKYINSSGIALLISFITSLQTMGGKLRVYGLSGHFHKIFEMVGLTQYLDICEDEPAALSMF